MKQKIITISIYIEKPTPILDALHKHMGRKYWESNLDKEIQWILKL